MPNWCSSRYAFTGEKKELQDMYNQIKKAETEFYVKNGFGEKWLGNIAMHYGLSYEETPCRGTLLGAELINEGKVLHLETETAWTPNDEMWRAIADKYETVDFVYWAEEPGMGVFINTDTSRSFFSDNYRVYYEIPKELCKDDIDSESEEYFPTEEEALRFINEMLDVKCTDINQIQKQCEEQLGEKLEECDEELYISVNEFTYV